MGILPQIIISGLVVGAIYALVALGIVVIYKSTQIFNFGQGGLVLMGAFFFYSFSVMMGLPLWLSLLLLLPCAIALGMLIERLFIRSFIGQRTFAPLAVTLCLLYFIRGLTFLIWGAREKVYPEGYLPEGVWFTGNLYFPQMQVIIFVGVLLLFLLVSLYFRYTRSGLAMRVTAENPQLAQSLGITVKRMFTNSWVIGTIVAVVGGFFLGTFHGVVQNLDEIGLKCVAVVLLGGLESIRGALVGGLCIGLLEALSAGYLTNYLGGGIAEVAPFVIMIVILLVRPYGFFGLKRIERI